MRSATGSIPSTASGSPPLGRGTRWPDEAVRNVSEPTLWRKAVLEVSHVLDRSGAVVLVVAADAELKPRALIAAVLPTAEDP